MALPPGPVPVGVFVLLEPTERRPHGSSTPSTRWPPAELRFFGLRWGSIRVLIDTSRDASLLVGEPGVSHVARLTTRRGSWRRATSVAIGVQYPPARLRASMPSSCRRRARRVSPTHASAASCPHTSLHRRISPISIRCASGGGCATCSNLDEQDIASGRCSWPLTFGVQDALRRIVRVGRVL